MKKFFGALAVVLFCLSYSSSWAYLGMSLSEMKKKLGEPVKQVNADTYLFETKAKGSDRLLKINAGDTVKIEAVIKDDKVVKETIYVPNKLDTQKDFLNWVWTYSQGQIKNINSPKTKSIPTEAEKAYSFVGGVWAVPRTDPQDGMVTAVTIGRE